MYYSYFFLGIFFFQARLYTAGGRCPGILRLSVLGWGQGIVLISKKSGCILGSCRPFSLLAISNYFVPCFFWLLSTYKGKLRALGKINLRIWDICKTLQPHGFHQLKCLCTDVPKVKAAFLKTSFHFFDNWFSKLLGLDSQSITSHWVDENIQLSGERDSAFLKV